MNQEEYIKFLEQRLKHSDEQLEKAMEMLAKLMSKMPVSGAIQPWWTDIPEIHSFNEYKGE